MISHVPGSELSSAGTLSTVALAVLHPKPAQPGLRGGLRLRSGGLPVDGEVVEFDSLDTALDGARAGDQWATTCLYRALNPPLLHYVRRHAPDVADDVASETWMAMAEKFAVFKGDAEGFRALLFTIARRRLADHYRNRARRPRLVALEEESTSATPADSSELALDMLATDQAIEALVRDLPADQAEVVLLRVVAGLSAEHVAQIMERSPGSVRVLQHRALRRLGKIWDRGAVTR